MLFAANHARFRLRAQRALCLVIGIGIPSSYYLFEATDPLAADALALHSAFAGLALLLLAGSFLSNRVREEFSGLTGVLVLVAGASAAVAAGLTNLAPEWALQALLFLGATGIALGGGELRLRWLILAVAVLVGALLSVALVVEQPIIPAWTFAAAVGAMAAGLLASGAARVGSHRELVAANRCYQAILEHSAEGVALLDAGSLRLLASNAAYSRISGLAPQELTSKTLFQVIAAPADDIAGAVRLTLAEGTAPLGELQHTRRDGSWGTVEAHLAVVPDERRQLLCLTIRDLTEAHRNRHQIERARDQAQATLALRNAFLNNMSHELKTPLVALTGFLDLLVDEIDELDPRDVAEMLGSLRRSAERLNQTLTSVIELAEIEAGEVRLVIRPVDLLEAVRQALAAVEPAAAEKGLELRVRSAERVRIMADPDALRRILARLLSNAVKFTAAGRITISVEADSHRVMLHVQDSGVGIRPEFLPRLFTPFHQASSGLDREHEGSGLGLAIAKRLLDLQGARIRVESTPGEGTCVSIAFARAFVEGAPARAGGDVAAPTELAATPPNAGLAPRPRVLIVEDNLDTARFLDRLLGTHFEVEVQHEATRALDRARQTWFDLLVIDTHLGSGIDGVTLLARMRSMSAYVHVPAIALVATTVSEEAVLLAGFDGHVVKPFTQRQLLRAIEAAQTRRAEATH